MKPLILAAALLLCSAADAPPRTYLAPGVVDLTTIVAPPPSPGDIRATADRRVYRAMRRRIGGARWQLATGDVVSATPAMLADFSCATGLALTPDAFPATTRLLNTAAADTGLANNAAKEHWRYPRPYTADHGETCQDKAEIGASYDYPSGHATKGWTFGLILAELARERTTPILARARAYGESRILCRVHTMSAVEAGMLGATATMTAVRATPAFQADLAAAKAEIAAARARGVAPDAGTCAAEAAASTPSVLAGVRR